MNYLIAHFLVALCLQQESPDKITHSFLVAGSQTYIVGGDD